MCGSLIQIQKGRLVFEVFSNSLLTLYKKKITK